MVDLIKALNASLCARVDEVQNATKALKHLDLGCDELFCRVCVLLDISRDPVKVIRDQDFFILQPLFRAVAVVIEPNTMTTAF